MRGWRLRVSNDYGAPAWLTLSIDGVGKTSIPSNAVHFATREDASDAAEYLGRLAGYGMVNAPTPEEA